MKRGWRIIPVILIIFLIMFWWLKTRSNDEQKEIPVTSIPTPVSEEEIKFGVMADIHLDWDEWSKYLEIALERGNEFVIIAGDMTSLGKETELRRAKQVLDDFGIRYYVVPGNHDLWMSTKIKQPLFNQIFGSDYQSFKQAGVKFILVNNGDAAGLGKVQTRWLEGEVTECRVITCIAVMHMPLQNSFSAHVMGEGSTEVAREAAWMIDLFRNNNVKEIITGHLHYSTSYETDGLRTTIVGAISRERNTQIPRYTEFTKVDGGLDWQVVEQN